MRYSIGLDVGISSVGYAIMELDSEDMPRRIERLGVRVFEKAEVPKTGDSLAAARRAARGARRRLRRHRHRLERIRGLIVSNGILSREGLERLYDGELSDIYETRTRALDEAVSAEETARIMIHLAQRRGFKSNRKSAAENDEESGNILAAVKNNQERMAEANYRTVGEMMYRDGVFADHKRNHGDYLNTVMRDDVEAEARLIFKRQRELGNTFVSEETETAYLDILLGQRSYADGPACGPYSGNQIERMRGVCTFFPDEPRAAKASYSFQLFNLCQHINHIRVSQKGSVEPLTREQRQTVFELAHKRRTLNYLSLRRALKLPDDCKFIGVKYDSDNRNKCEENVKINDLKNYHEIKACMPDELFDALTQDNLDDIAEAFFKNISDELIREELLGKGISEETVECLFKLTGFSGTGHLSLKACRMIIPHLMEGLTYDKARDAAGLHLPVGKKGRYLKPLPQDDASITSPVARRSISQCIKVVNAIIREMGESPVYLNIELARELAKSYKDRKMIEKEQSKNRARNDELADELAKKNGSYTAHDILKLRLWKEQDGRCIYSGEPIEIDRLTDPGYTEVDHIVPYSISFDDTRANKVLVLTRENREKGNRLPLQYLTGKVRDDFMTRVECSRLVDAKKRRLLTEKLPEDRDWKQRNLQDTQYIAAYLHKYISDGLVFLPFADGRKKHVTAVSGAITAYVRRRWGIEKVRENGDSHHAVDAAVIACITQGMINRISTYSANREMEYAAYAVDKRTGEVKERFPTPWPHFRDELKIRLDADGERMRKVLYDVNYDTYGEIELSDVKPFFISRMSDKGIKGSAHKDTVMGARHFDKRSAVISKKKLTELKLKEGEIEGYYNKESDLLLYNALLKRLKAHNGNAKEAFKDEFRKPKSDGTPGPVVKKVKIEETVSSVVKVNDGTGVAGNESMVRCDVFYVEGDGYYFVPIYVPDTVKPQLPSLAPTKKRDENGNKVYKTMSDENFLFSLYKNDLIKIFSKRDISFGKTDKNSELPEKLTLNGSDGAFLYYQGFDVANAVVSAVNHDNTYCHRSIGKTMQKIEKYEVDVLGNIRKVERETRRDFSGMKKDK